MPTEVNLTAKIAISISSEIKLTPKELVALIKTSHAALVAIDKGLQASKSKPTTLPA